jgi:hypothetical protein
MKPLCIIMSLVLLFTGCYSHTTVTQDTPTLDNEDITVTLADDSYIISKGGQHHRVENGYKIAGELRQSDWYSLSYRPPDSLVDVILRDEQIKEVVVDKFETTTTIVAVGIPLVLIGLILIIEPKVGGSLWTMHGEML